MLIPTGNLKAGNSYEIFLALYHNDVKDKELAKVFAILLSY